MVEDPGQLGVFSVQFTVGHSRPDFVIVRDNDWSQVFYAPPNLCAVPGAALGPDIMAVNSGWLIAGCRKGDVYRIEFRRDGEDGPRVSWERVKRGAEVAPGTFDEYFLVTTWGPSLKMHWTGSFYEAILELGEKAEASFYMTKGGSPNLAIRPSFEDVSPHSEHALLFKPRQELEAYCWNVGKAFRDQGSRGKRYRISLIMQGDQPSHVQWENVDSVAVAEDAMARSFYAVGE